MKTKTIAPAESAKRLANLEYEFLLAINALDELAEGVLHAYEGFPKPKALRLRCVVIEVRERLEQTLAEIDLPITKFVRSVGG